MNIVCQAHVLHDTGWSGVGGKPVDVLIYEP